MRSGVAARAVLLAAGIAVALPASARLSTKIYGQQLVDELLTRHPEVLLIGLHVTPPGEADNVIIASNFGRLGKKADEDDLNLNYKDGDDRQSLERMAGAIRDELKRRTADAANLLEPYPFDPAATTLTHAQKLVDRTLEQYTGLLAMRLCTASAAAACSVIASSVGRIGSQADRVAAAVLHAGKPLLEVDAVHAERLNVHLPLTDSSGKIIGIVTLIHRYKEGDDKSALLASSTRIRDALSSQVVSTAALLALDP
jgi:hypothetical protein